MGIGAWVVSQTVSRSARVPLCHHAAVFDRRGSPSVVRETARGRNPPGRAPRRNRLLLRHVGRDVASDAFVDQRRVGRESPLRSTTAGAAVRPRCLRARLRPGSGTRRPRPRSARRPGGLALAGHLGALMKRHAGHGRRRHGSDRGANSRRGPRRCRWRTPLSDKRAGAVDSDQPGMGALGCAERDVRHPGQVGSNDEQSPAREQPGVFVAGIRPRGLALPSISSRALPGCAGVSPAMAGRRPAHPGSECQHRVSPASSAMFLRLHSWGVRLQPAALPSRTG
jgi:hypothetical protein